MEKFMLFALALMIACPIAYIIYAIGKNINELGQKDAIDKACEWLDKNLALYIDYDDEGNLVLNTKNFVDYFKRRIEQ